MTDVTVGFWQNAYKGNYGRVAFGAQFSARLGLALNAASTLVFRGVVHTKVNAVPLFCVVDKKIFQNVLPVCWSERFFADSAMN